MAYRSETVEVNIDSCRNSDEGELPNMGNLIQRVNEAKERQAIAILVFALVLFFRSKPWLASVINLRAVI